MDRELEVAGAASLGGWLRWRKEHAVEPGAPCANCETPLQGPYCYNCGQLAESFERSVWHLVVEGFESFFHFDGRFWATLPNLLLHPQRLTRAYLDGKRAGQIPPLRLFLVVLLILFFVGGLNLGGNHVQTKQMDQLTPAQRAQMEAALDKAHVTLKPAAPNAPTVAMDVRGKRAAVSSNKPSNGFEAWAEQRLRYAAGNQELFYMTLETWGHRFAVLMLPISALFLTALFAFQRRFYVFDHLIFSMHSLSFQGLLLSVVFLLGGVVPLVGWLLVLAPVHLFVHMRGTYGTGVFGTLLRMTLLFVGSAVAFLLLILGLLWVGLSAMNPH
jgi:hypothetical protein